MSKMVDQLAGDWIDALQNPAGYTSRYHLKVIDRGVEDTYKQVPGSSSLRLLILPHQAPLLPQQHFFLPQQLPRSFLQQPFALPQQPFHLRLRLDPHHNLHLPQRVNSLRALAKVTGGGGEIAAGELGRRGSALGSWWLSRAIFGEGVTLCLLLSCTFSVQCPPSFSG